MRNSQPQPAHATANVAPFQIKIVSTPESNAAGTTDSSVFSEYWQAITRRIGTILLIACLSALAAFLIALPQTPVYQAHTALEIQGLNENFLNMKEVDPTTSAGNNSAELYIQTQVRMLQDEALVERAVAKLKLDQRAEFQKPGRPSLVEKILRRPSGKPLTPREQAVAMATGNLKVRVSGQTRIVEVLFDSPDPELAADFANTVANEFIEQSLEVRWKTAEKTSEWLTRQLTGLKSKLERSQEQLLAYAKAAGLMFTSEKGSMAQENLRWLQEELFKVKSERVAKQSKYETATSRAQDSLPEVLDSEPLRASQMQLNDLRRQEAELSAQFTPAFYKVKNVQIQIAELESILNKERAKIVERIRDDYETALRREKLVANVYGEQINLVTEQGAKAVHYDILKGEVDTNRGIYEAMLQKVKEAGVASAMRAGNIRVITPARPPSRPYKPNVALNTALGLGAGVLLGTVFVLQRERVGRSIRAPGDSRSYLDVPELGVIPSSNGDFKKRTYGWRSPVLELTNYERDDGRQTSGVELVTWERKPSLLAESFRATLASILFAGQNGSRPRVMVLTSPDRGGGKTTMVSNLGIALAEINRRVLLVDGDMRKPRLHDIFDLPNDEGLGSLLRAERPIDEYPLERLVCATKIPGLYVLPSNSGADDISMLLYSQRMAELLGRFRLEFHTVLIDTPPMLQMPDARILGRMADGVILVLRAARTLREDAIAATERFREDGTPVVGTILNHWEPHNTPSAYYGYGPRNATRRPNGQAS